MTRFIRSRLSAAARLAADMYMEDARRHETETNSTQPVTAPTPKDTEMPTLNDLFPSPYLKANEIADSGERVMTISHIVMKKMKNKEGGEDNKPILFFYEAEKGMILNKSNGRIIASLYGEDFTQWGGKRVTLYAEIGDSFGQMQLLLKVRPQAPAAPANGHQGTPEDKAALGWEDPKTIWQNFVRKEQPTTDEIKKALGTEKVSEWIGAEPGRTVAKAITLVRDQLGLREPF